MEGIWSFVNEEVHLGFMWIASFKRSVELFAAISSLPQLGRNGSSVLEDAMTVFVEIQHKPPALITHCITSLYHLSVKT
jgi:hypothetical protein